MATEEDYPPWLFPALDGDLASMATQESYSSDAFDPNLVDMANPDSQPSVFDPDLVMDPFGELGPSVYGAISPALAEADCGLVDDRAMRPLGEGGFSLNTNFCAPGSLEATYGQLELENNRFPGYGSTPSLSMGGTSASSSSGSCYAPATSGYPTPFETSYNSEEVSLFAMYGPLLPLGMGSASSLSPSGSIYAPAGPVSDTLPVATYAIDPPISRIAKASQWLATGYASPYKSDALDANFDSSMNVEDVDDHDAEETRTNAGDEMEVDADPQKLTSHGSAWTTDTMDTEEEEHQDFLQLARVPTLESFAEMEEDEEDALAGPSGEQLADDGDDCSDESSLTALPPDDMEVCGNVQASEDDCGSEDAEGESDDEEDYEVWTIPMLFQMAAARQPAPQEDVPATPRRSTRVRTSPVKFSFDAIPSPSKPSSQRLSSPSKPSSARSTSSSKPSSTRSASPSKSPKVQTPRRAKRDSSPSKPRTPQRTETPISTPSRKKGKSPSVAPLSTASTASKPESRSDISFPPSPSKSGAKAWTPPLIASKDYEVTEDGQAKCGVEGCGGTMCSDEASIEAHLSGEAHVNASSECGWVNQEGEKCEHSIRGRGDLKERFARHIATVHLPTTHTCPVCETAKFVREEQAVRHISSTCRRWREIKNDWKKRVSDQT